MAGFLNFLLKFLTDEQKKKLGAIALCIILIGLGAYGAVSTKEIIVETAQAAQPKYDDSKILQGMATLAKRMDDQELDIKNISDRQLKHGSKLDRMGGQLDLVLDRL